METKKLTLLDAEKAYKDQNAAIETSQKIEDEIFNSEVLKKWVELGLQPKRMEERGIVVFDHKGKEIKFNCYKFDSRWWQVVRIRECPDCGCEERSTEKGFTLEEIGNLLLSPFWEYHEHSFSNDWRGKWKRFIFKTRKLFKLA